MAIHDIMPYRPGEVPTVTANIGASSTSTTTNTSFRAGEVLLLNVSAGDVDVIPDGVEAVTTTHYIAGVASADLIQANNLTDPVASGEGAEVQMYSLTGPNAVEFVTQYVVTGSDTQLTTTEKDALFVGDTVGLWRDNTATGTANNGENGRFSVDSASTGLKIVRKLDSLGQNSDISGNATVSLVVVSDGV